MYLVPVQGDQIGRIFNIWLLFTWVFLKFHLNKQFQNTVCCTYCNIQKQFDATIFDFQFELFVIWLQFWLHFQKLGDFFQTSGHSGKHDICPWQDFQTRIILTEAVFLVMCDPSMNEL